eukprot:1158836-Pelagomonas_calceolata.AAC.6
MHAPQQGASSTTARTNHNSMHQPEKSAFKGASSAPATPRVHACIKGACIHHHRVHQGCLPLKGRIISLNSRDGEETPMVLEQV